MIGFIAILLEVGILLPRSSVTAAFTEMTNPLNGKHLRVIWPNWEGNPKGLTGPLKGRVMLEYLRGRFNFTYEFVRITENWFEATNETRGQFTYLFNDEADLNMGAIAPRSERIHIVDLTYGFSFDAFSILIPVSDQVSSNMVAVVKPFRWLVWLMLLISVAIVTVVFTKIQSRMLRSITTNEIQQQQHRLRLKITNPYLYVFGNILSQGGYYTINRLPIRLIAGTWSLAAFVFVQAYTSTLITYVVAPTTYPLIKSFQDLAFTPDIRLHLKNHGTIEFILTISDQTEFVEKIKTRITKPSCVLAKDCVRQVESGTKNVYIDSKLFLIDAIKQRFDQTKKCDIQIVDYGLLNVISCFALQKNSPYTSTISQGLIELRENGLFNFWDSWYRPIPRQCAANVKGLAEKEANHDRLRRLSLKNLTGAFVILFIGLGLSFAAFLRERLQILCFPDAG